MGSKGTRIGFRDAVCVNIFFGERFSFPKKRRKKNTFSNTDTHANELAVVATWFLQRNYFYEKCGGLVFPSLEQCLSRPGTDLGWACSSCWSICGGSSYFIKNL